MNVDFLADKVVWVTGGSKGIGLALVNELVKYGAKVAFSASSQKEYFISNEIFTSDEINSDTLFYIECDASSSQSIKDAAQKITNKFGKIDILINNAGVSTFKPFLELSEDEFDRMNNINYKAIFTSMQAVLPKMIENHSGTIVNIISVAALKTFEMSSVYAASKAAIRAMTGVVRKEYRKNGIKILDVFPGAVSTEIWPEPLRTDWKEKMMLPEDIATVIVENIALAQNPRLQIEEIVIRPQGGDL